MQQYDKDSIPKIMESSTAFLAIRNELKKSGITSYITAQLRKQVYDALQNHKNTPKPHSNQCQNLEQAAIRSLILEYLLCDNLQQTASVFAAESNYMDGRFLSKKDSLRIYGIIPKSHTYSTLMKNVVETYEDTAIHMLLLQAFTASKDSSNANVASQTNIDSNNYLLAREHLNSKLEMIHKKYEHHTTNTVSRHDFELSIESKLSSIQKECDDRAKKEFEGKLKLFQDQTVSSMRKEEEEKRQKDMAVLRLELQQDYDNKIKIFLKRQDDLKLQYDLKARENEASLMKARETMRLEMEKLKQKDDDAKTTLELERKKLQLEEQRIQNILAAAEAKLDLAGKKEMALRDDIETEYNRVRSQAKQALEDVSIITKQHNDKCTKSLQEIRTLQEALSEKIGNGTNMSAESSVYAEKQSLIQELELQKKEIENLRHSIQEKDDKYLESMTISNRHLQENQRKLQEITEELTNQSRKHECAVSHNEELKLNIDRLQQHLQEALTQVQEVTLEKVILSAELEETKILFQRSQAALVCKTETRNSGIQSHINLDKSKDTGIDYLKCSRNGMPQVQKIVPSNNSSLIKSSTHAVHQDTNRNIPMKVPEIMVRDSDAKSNNQVRKSSTMIPVVTAKATDPRKSKRQEVEVSITDTIPKLIHRVHNTENSIVRNSSIHSIATLMTWDISPIKERIEVDTHKGHNIHKKGITKTIQNEKVKVKQQEVQDIAKSVEKKETVVMKITDAVEHHTSHNTSFIYDKLDLDIESNDEIIKGDDSKLSSTSSEEQSRQGSTNNFERKEGKGKRNNTDGDHHNSITYDMDDFETMSDGNTEKNQSKSTSAGGSPSIKLSLNPKEHEILPYKPKIDSNQQIDSKNSQSPNNSSNNSFESSRVSKSSTFLTSQLESISSTGIEVFGYNNDNNQSDWW